MRAPSDYSTARISKIILINYLLIRFKCLIRGRTLGTHLFSKKTNSALLIKAMVIGIVVRTHNVILIVFWEIVIQKRPKALLKMMEE